MKCFATLKLGFRVTNSYLKDFDMAVHQTNQIYLQTRLAQAGYLYY